MDDDFEFNHISGDHNEGQIPPVFPLFNRDLLKPNDQDQSDGNKLRELALRLPLDKSFAVESDDKERDPPSSPSSESEADELRCAPADDYYCSRKPEEAVEKPPRTYRKSDSAGALASKEWKLSDFLHRRSSSEGTEDSLVFYSPKDRGLEAEMKEITIETDQKAAKTNAIEVFYGRKQGEKRKSFVPYRQELAGFFVNVNAYGKAFSRFKNRGGLAPLRDGLPSPKPCP